MISILIAARNEEATIINCLQSVSKLSFPSHQFEVLIGNDASEDQTATLVEDFIKDKPNFHLFNIKHSIGLARGKANVLAQLARQAKGEIFCITDADVQVPHTWLQSMKAVCKDKVGVVNGITVVKGKTLFHKLQALDWIYALSVVSLLSTWQIPVTAMGNNMLVTREAYMATGGYENIPFSVTEDYVLFHAILSKGYTFVHLFDEQVKAYTEPVPTFLQLLQQRKRWMVGALQLPFYLQSIFYLQAFFLPLLVCLFMYLPEVAFIVLLTKFFIESSYLCWALKRINELALLKYVLLYEAYLLFLSIAMLFYYLKPGKLLWKGREYQH